MLLLAHPDPNCLFFSPSAKMGEAGGVCWWRGDWIEVTEMAEDKEIHLNAMASIA